MASAGAPAPFHVLEQRVREFEIAVQVLGGKMGLSDPY